MNSKGYAARKQDGSWFVYTPQGKRIVVPHKTRREAQQVADIFNHTKRDPATVVTFKGDGDVAEKPEAQPTDNESAVYNVEFDYVDGGHFSELSVMTEKQAEQVRQALE